MKTKLIFIGGFLGAGKTTMLAKLAELLTAQGKCIGMITNDQAENLVDTALLKKSGSVIAEVSGSCFCCNFPGLDAAIRNMQQGRELDYILAEPVGSCTDLSATILQPLKEKLSEAVSPAPLCVLADPLRLQDILRGGNSGLPKSAAYIVKKQMEEADMLVINKSDLLTEREAAGLKQTAEYAFPKAKVFFVSALTGEGIEKWLQAVLLMSGAGTHLTEVDYDVYAEGEAMLGWLNARISLQHVVAGRGFIRSYLGGLSEQFAKKKAGIGHVKVLLEGEEGYALGNLTGMSPLQLREKGSTEGSLMMTLNARVQMEPEDLQKIVVEELSRASQAGVCCDIRELRCLKPGRPHPTYRYCRIA